MDTTQFEDGEYSLFNMTVNGQTKKAETETEEKKESFLKRFFSSLLQSYRNKKNGKNTPKDYKDDILGDESDDEKSNSFGKDPLELSFKEKLEMKSRSAVKDLEDSFKETEEAFDDYENDSDNEEEYYNDNKEGYNDNKEDYNKNKEKYETPFSEEVKKMLFSQEFKKFSKQNQINMFATMLQAKTNDDKPIITM